MYDLPFLELLIALNHSGIKQKFLSDKQFTHPLSYLYNFSAIANNEAKISTPAPMNMSNSIVPPLLRIILPTAPPNPKERIPVTCNHIIIDSLLGLCS